MRWAHHRANPQEFADKNVRAPLDPIFFGCGCSPTGEPLFPSPVWGKACITIAQNFRSRRKFFGDLKYSNTEIDSRQACPEFNRRGAKHAKFGIERLIILQTILFIFSDLCGLGVPSTLLRTCFAGDIPSSFFAFFAPFAANFPVPNPFWLRLCRAGFLRLKSYPKTLNLNRAPAFLTRNAKQRHRRLDTNLLSK
ncbi:MAG: hypothetical protein HW419_4526 [Deltaproteobacteria bacterium]|nr:hypothetical protein [Deltaproteobacteria bacterium]